MLLFIPGGGRGMWGRIETHGTCAFNRHSIYIASMGYPVCALYTLGERGVVFTVYTLYSRESLDRTVLHMRLRVYSLFNV